MQKRQKTTVTSPAKKFRKSAQSLQKKIDHKRSPRLTNTAKRMREWESAIQDALHMEKLQDKLYALADGWDTVTLPIELSTLKDVAQVEYLLFQERPPTSMATDSYKRMERAELLDPDRYAAARNALLEMGNARAGQEDKSIQLKRIEMDVDNSRIVGYFPTPDAVIRTMLEQVEIEINPGDHILEPSAGKGSIADVLREEYPDAVLHCVEWNHSLREILELKEHTVICDDIFDENLTAYHHKYKLICMNPPWGKEYGAAEDARHILHCYENFLAEDGQLVSIVSASAAYNQNKDYAKFREFVDERGYFVDVPQGAFSKADRSTGVSVKIVVLDKRSDNQYVPQKPVVTEEPEKVDMRRLILDLDMTALRRDAAGAKVDMHLRQLGYAKDNKMIDGHILNYAAVRARRCVLPVFTAKLIGLPESELQRLVDEKRLATVELQRGQTGYHITWQGAAYTTYLWEHLKPKIDKFLDWYVVEPDGISEIVIRDLEEALTLMKQIHDANTEKPEMLPIKERDIVRSKVWGWHGTVTRIEIVDGEPVYWGFVNSGIKAGFSAEASQVEPTDEKPLQVNDRVRVPHMNEAGTIQEINGANVRLMLDSGTAMQTHLSCVNPIYKEETAISPRKQVQNSPVDEKPKTRQLEMFS